MSAKIVAEEDTDMNRGRVILIVSLSSWLTGLVNDYHITLIL